MDNTTSFSNKIAIILDSVAYQSKPKKEAALIQYRFKEAKPAILTVEEVARAVTSGQTVKPCVCFGPKDNQRYVCQSLFFLDFDNDSNVISSEEAVRYAKSHGLVPAFGYHSFSSTPEHEKFRLVFRSKYPILDPNLRDKIQATLMNIFKDHCDAKCKDRTRIFFGGKTAPFWLDPNAVFTPEEISAYAPAAPAPAKQAAAKQAKQAAKPVKPAAPKSEPCAQITDLEEQFSEKPAQLTKLQENNLKSIKRALDRLLLSRKWVEGSKRHNFLYISFHTVWALEGAQAALQYVIKANKSFAMPVKEREIVNALLWKNETHEDGEFFEKWQAPEPLIYGKKRVISDLRLSKKEITSSKIYFVERKKKRAHIKAQKNQEKSALRDQFIAEQYFHGLRAKRIFAILPEDLKEGCSGPSSIEYTIKRLGLKNCKSVSDVRFDECARYQKRSYPKQRAFAGERQRIEAIIKEMCKEPGKKKKVKSKVNFSNTLTCESYKDFLKTAGWGYGVVVLSNIDISKALIREFLDKQYLDKQYLDKQYLAKQYSAKQYSAKQYSAKQYSAKQDFAKEYSAKEYLAKEFSAKQYLAKQCSAKEFSAKQCSAKQYFDKQYLDEQYSAKQYLDKQCSAKEFSTKSSLQRDILQRNILPRSSLQSDILPRDSLPRDSLPRSSPQTLDHSRAPCAAI